MPLFRKPVPQDPLVVAMTGTRLGHRVVLVPSNHDDVVLAIGAKVGLTGHVAVVTPDDARRHAIRTRALNAGLLVEVERDIEAAAGEPPFDLAVVDARGTTHVPDAAVLGGLYARLRQGGRLTLLLSAGGGLGALFGGGTAPDTGPYTKALLAAGFRTARLLATRERIAFVEALKS